MTRLPAKAKQEITEQLLKNMEITPEEAMAICRKYEIREDPQVLQERYLRTKVQQFLATFRDADGNRDVFAVRDSKGVRKYTIIDACNDLSALKIVRHPTIFLGGGAALLKRHLPASAGLCRAFLLDDVTLNAKGFERLCRQLSRREANG